MRINSEIQIKTSKGEVFNGICKDLSATGMQIFVEQPVAVGQELSAVLKGTGDHIPPLETICEVLRCDKDGDGYLLGTAINEVN
jgi:hypothetical protein